MFISNKFRIILFGLLASLSGCNAKESSEKNSVNNELPKKISEYAYNNYTEDQFPKMYKKWGVEWMSKFSDLEHKAANKIANENNTCDSIEVVALSENRSTPKKEAVFFVDCLNGERFYVSQNDLDKSTIIESQSKKAVSQDMAFDSCQKMIKNNAKYPSSVNFKLLDSTGFTAKTTGNVVVLIGFEAKNALGAILPAKAKCIFTPEGESEITYIE
ncbi:hypothetical protein AAV97_18375 [Acinetobacter sp. Ag2]|uniref:hypothetical protein n=1 Tax=Acinetobacter TaxID=469 RepID=UPI0006293815|nr:MULTISPECIES: hypothetical protein [Acinetobacter]KKW75752.1 hypothetical protein AAV97_18375 [Acinetobacter sp. Ag2]